MIKKLTALTLILCIMFCMSACELDSSNPDESTSVINTSSEIETDIEDVFSDEAGKMSSEITPDVQSVEQTTSATDVSSEAATSEISILPSSKEQESSVSSDSDKSTSSIIVSNIEPSKEDSVSKVTVPEESETVGNLVWVPTNGGKKYHTHSGCSNMKDPMQVTKETAESNGYTPCKRCY